MESDEEGSDEQLISVPRSFSEYCVFCKSPHGMKLPFCRVCARMDGVIQLESTYVHRQCVEKRMDRNRRIKCLTCENVMTICYSGALHDDYALRNMREAFNCCFPAADRTLGFNFISVKSALLAGLSLMMFVLYTVIASQATEGGWMIASKIALTVGFATFLLSWFISSSSALMYITLYGSIRKAKQQLVSECVLNICVAAASLVSAIAWKNLLSLEKLFGVWSILVSLMVLAIVVITVIDKMKTYSKLAMVGITMQVHADP